VSKRGGNPRSRREETDIKKRVVGAKGGVEREKRGKSTFNTKFAGYAPGVKKWFTKVQGNAAQ